MLNLVRPLLAWVLITSTVFAGVLEETNEDWTLIKINGQDAGYAHTVTREIQGDGGETLIETTTKSLMRMGRLGATMEAESETVFVESAEGEIVRMSGSNKMAKNTTSYEGVVQGDELHVTTNSMGREFDSTMEWPEDCWGPEKAKSEFVASGFVKGTTLTFHSFDFSVGVIEVTSTFEGMESVDVDGTEKNLRRILSTSDVVPRTLSWVNAEGVALLTEMNMAGMAMSMIVVNRERVTDYLEEGITPEIFVATMLESNVLFPKPREMDRTVYLIQPRELDLDLPDFGQDDRQTVLETDEGDEGSFKLQVDLLIPPESRTQTRPLARSSPELMEYLETNSMIQSDEAPILDLALRSIGTETDAWNAAVLLEKATYDYIDEKNYDTGFATALEVYEEKSGDCSEHAVLLAALCRAVGIPSRVCMGLVYVEIEKGKGVFGGHAWTEVSIDDRWYALDATLGQGSADPTHITMGSSSLADGGFSGGMIGVIHGLGNMDLEILEYTLDGNTVGVKRSPKN